jgi:DNA-binding response OmpR family regulator
MAVSAVPVPSRQPTILVFDDEEDLRDIMCRMLQRRGFTALAAADPREAVAACRRYDGEIDVLLADLGMPDAVGVEVARETTALRPGLRVLYVTGLPKDAAVRQGIVDESATVVQKPFTTENLINAVRAALRAPAGSHTGVR